MDNFITKSTILKAMNKNQISDKSFLMKLFLILGLTKLSWSVRRLYCPVTRDSLVLEVGSGGNPYPRSNVLIDAYENTSERHWAPLIKDRPTVLGYGEKLPFGDKVFDFVIASHVLEHSPNPEIFLSELERVGKAGYIETPDAFMERINPYPDHRLEVTNRNSTLEILKKKNWIIDQDIVNLYEAKSKKIIAEYLIPKEPEKFHVRFYWFNKIKFKILNSEVKCDWDVKVSPENKIQFKTFKSKFRLILTKLLRYLFSQNKRNKKIDILDILMCTKCNSKSLEKIDNTIICTVCKNQYIYKNGLLVA